MEFPRLFRRTQLITPLVYNDSLSYLEMLGVVIERLNARDDDLSKLVTLEQFNEFVSFIELEQAQQTQLLMEYTDSQLFALDMTLRAIIDELIAGQVVIQDPTFGQYPRSAWITVFNVYDRLRDYGSYNAVEFDEHITPLFTATQLDTLTFTALDHDLYSRTRIS